MNHALSKYLDACSGLRVLVIGEAMLDSYLEGGSSRLCRREQETPCARVHEQA